MYYLKKKIADGVELRFDIDLEDIFTICPACGQEFRMELVELIEATEGDLCGVQIYCPECSKKLQSQN